MTIPDPLISVGLKIEPPAVGQGNTAIGSPAFVLNSDALVQSFNYDDPYSALQSTHATDDDIQPAVVPAMGSWLELWHVVRGSGGMSAQNTSPSSSGSSEELISVTQSPRVRAYGKRPDPSFGFQTGNARHLQKRLWPQDLDSNFPDFTEKVGADSSVSRQMGFWHLLENPDVSEAYLDLGTAAGLLYVSAGYDYYVSRKQTVYLAGCVEIMVTIERIATLANSDGASMIVGAFVG
jgi:hypothetical protein